LTVDGNAERRLEEIEIGEKLSLPAVVDVVKGIAWSELM
jgi:hypothetical protein